MTQAERDRLVALKKAKKKLITQKQAAEEIGITERQVRRLLRRLNSQGDKAVLHGLRGRPSNRKLEAARQEQAMQILSDPIYEGFGPTLAAEHLRKKHSLTVSKETLRQWMSQAGLWKCRQQRLVKVHQWRERRSCFGDLVQWDTSEHDWLEGRGEKIYLISMIDDATSRLFARFVRQDSTPENMRVLEQYLNCFGRPLGFYTDKASLFQTAVKIKRGEPRVGKDDRKMPLTQIGRALQELNIVWIAAHSPQAKGRVERQFATTQDRLVKEMRVAGVCTIEEANRYLKEEFLPWWNETLAVQPANATDSHRPLGKEHNLAAILSEIEERQVTNDYTIRYQGNIYQIDRNDIRAGMRGNKVQIENRLDESIAIRFQSSYLRVTLCLAAAKVKPKTPETGGAKPAGKSKGSDWNRNFDLHKAPKIWQVLPPSNSRRKEPAA